MTLVDADLSPDVDLSLSYIYICIYIYIYSPRMQGLDQAPKEYRHKTGADPAFQVGGD
jgi:hypothetical protein